MENSSNKTPFSNRYGLEINQNGIERRKHPRRDQPDRREIVRFGYAITTRRSGSDRRKYHNVSKMHENK